MKAADLPSFYNASSILEDNLTHSADKISLYSDSRVLTFRQVADEANQVANALIESGVCKEKRVGILVPDIAEWATSFFGIIKIGAVAVCMNTLLQPQEYEYILRDSGLHVLIVHQSLLSLIEPIGNQIPTLEQIVVIGLEKEQREQIQSLHVEPIAFEEWIQPQPTRCEAVLTHRDDFCSLHYSSGTTGQPKGMFHAHKDYALIAQNTGVDLLQITEEDRTFSIAKLFFVYGLGGNLVMPWYAGASIVLYSGSPRIATGVLETIERFNPTILYGVPTAYITQLTVKKMATRYDLSSLRLCISAGEALPASVWQQWNEATGLEILDTIGCTETFHTFLANRPDDLRPGSSGKPSPGYEVKLIDDAGNDVQQGEIGNLLVKGETVSQFYLNQEELSRHAFRDEWLFTGDKYYQDKDGFYWHSGRADDMFKVGGLWVSPVEVESVLTSHPAVTVCAVVGQEDQQHMMKPKAYVCMAEDYTPTTDPLHALLVHCSHYLTAYKCPRWIEFVDDLPKTATGKIQRFKLR